MSDGGSGVDAAALERFRQSGIRVDKQGAFWHEGERVDHEGLRRAFQRWLDRLPDGRFVLRLDERRYVYLEVEDTPLVATSLRIDGTGDAEVAFLGLNDGTEERLDPASLTVDADGVLRAGVRGGRLEARLATAALATLGERLGEQDGGVTLALAGRRVVVRTRAS